MHLSVEPGGAGWVDRSNTLILTLQYVTLCRTKDFKRKRQGTSVKIV